jgi:hypothetical protein
MNPSNGGYRVVLIPFSVSTLRLIGKLGPSTDNSLFRPSKFLCLRPTGFKSEDSSASNLQTNAVYAESRRESLFNKTLPCIDSAAVVLDPGLSLAASGLL